MSHFDFTLNGSLFRGLEGSAGSFVAFSGDGSHRNKAGSTNVPDDGPIPQGSYYIVERPSGGRVGQFEKLRSALVAGGTSPVPGSSLRRYGTVSVI